MTVTGDVMILSFNVRRTWALRFSSEIIDSGKNAGWNEHFVERVLKNIEYIKRK